MPNTRKRVYVNDPYGVDAIQVEQLSSHIESVFEATFQYGDVSC